MISDLTKVLDQVSREKGVERDVLIRTLEEAVRAAARKKLGQNYDLEINFNDDLGEIEIFEFKEVVENEFRYEREIHMDRAFEFRKRSNVPGGHFKISILFESLGGDETLCLTSCRLPAGSLA